MTSVVATTAVVTLAAGGWYFTHQQPVGSTAAAPVPSQTTTAPTSAAPTFRLDEAHNDPAAEQNPEDGATHGEGALRLTPGDTPRDAGRATGAVGAHHQRQQRPVPCRPRSEPTVRQARQPVSVR
ncbi:MULTISPECIES: hypothetical protein [unclassified Streptomyces]|uniref:hypothetical protein n=1 Tax=unclassified Streptomyces TaxID=2593676 RepID=UPI002E7A308F|nr:hypothetical protein [Streptomyces sp. JV184]MEE1744474.1 hypothetical protein [Streptomyces sp. JV184]